MADGTCTLCPRPEYAHGYCAPHWKRWYKTGDPQPGVPIGWRYNRTDAERFWPKVDKHGPVPEHAPDLGQCWVWTAALFEGYGNFRFNGRMGKSYVWAWEDANGAVPEGLELDHLCRNKACVRPSHLEAVTHVENLNRMVNGVTQMIRDARESTMCRRGLHPLGPPRANGKRCCGVCAAMTPDERKALDEQLRAMKDDAA